MSSRLLKEVLTYSPKALKFGTSGVRAKVEELTDLEVYCLTRGTLAYLERIGKLVLRPRARETIAIPLAGDLRPSTPRLLKATARAILDAGFQVDYGGFLPTPALTYYALERGVASFMVTGSHIPADRNGQKANRCDGEVLKGDEAGIIALVEQLRAQEYSLPLEESKFLPDGSLKPEHVPELPKINAACAKVYRDRYREGFGPQALKGLKVLFFEHSAVGRELVPQILADAGAEVISVGRCEEFIPLDTEAISEAQLELLGGWVKKKQPIDAVVTTDGDSDRPLLMGVKAGEIRVFPGDLLGATVAEFLKADAAAVPISANPTLEDWLAARGISLRRTRIGSPYVIEAMASLKASGKRVVAWEANGGFLLGSSLALGEKVLKALPTRDAVLPILSALSFAKQRQRDLASLMERFPKSFGWSDLIEDFPREDGQRLVAYFAPQDLSVEEVSFARGEIVLLGEGGRELFRLPEADPQAELWLERKKRLEEVFSARLGFSPLVGINVLDGVRCRFADGEVAHFRPSGNAPQLRIYAYAATLARAREIAKLAVAKGGLLELLAHKL
jgi:phosphomannomutase